MSNKLRLPPVESLWVERPSALRLVIMGTGPFAVPMFRALLDSSHQVVALVTRPDRPVHRREKSPINPMRELGQQRGLEVFEPESINSAEAIAWLHKMAADLLVVCDYGQILSNETLSLSRLGGINLHASLLPKYRGAAPINWAIYHGETETGVTVIHMTPQLDAGPELVQKSTAIGSNETASELEGRLAELGVGAVLEAIGMLARGEQAAGVVQDPKLATKAPRLKKEDGLVDWSRSAVQIANQVRAFQPWPKTYTHLQRSGSEPMRVILEKVTPLDESDVISISQPKVNKGDLPPGTVVDVRKDALLVKCGTQVLAIDSIQPVGKRAMRVDQFLCGHPIQIGDKFG